jgi:predicted enzyme related to lactoylglutathione lyase
MDYQLATTVAVDEKGIPKEPGSINGALYLRESPEECQSIVISVPSIDEYLKKIEKADCKVIGQKSPVEDFGFYARVAPIPRRM